MQYPKQADNYDVDIFNSNFKELADQTISLDTTKFDKTEAQGLFKDVSFNRSNGVITFTLYNGTTKIIDTLLEKLAVNFDFNEEKQRLVIMLDDGTEKYVDLSSFITQNEFTDSDTIAFTVDESGRAVARVKGGSIEEKHLRPDYLADIKVEAVKAQESRQAAAESQQRAEAAEAVAVAGAAAAEKNANEAKGYADKAGISAESSSQNAKTAEESAAQAKEYADQAEKSASGNVASATKLADAKAIDGMNFDGSTNIAHYTTCSTAAATAAKVAALTGFKLVTGASVKVKFTVTNTAANPTLNVNGTGAKAIYYRGSAISASYLAANRTYEFVYNGTQYEFLGDINVNTTYAAMTAATASAAGNAGLVPAPAAGKQTSFLRGDGKWVVPTNTTYSNFVKSGSGAKAGLVPAPSTTAGATKYLREDGTWQEPPVSSSAIKKIEVVSALPSDAASHSDTLYIIAG